MIYSELYHYGVSVKDGSPGRGSGRYPYGSGDRPFQDKLITKRQISIAEKGKDRSQFIDAHKIPKGTKMYRTTVDLEDADGPIYVTYLPSDRDYYRSTYASTEISQRSENKNKNIYENVYVLKNDLKIPSRSDLTTAKEKILKNPETYYKIVNEYIRQKMDEVKYAKISDFTPEEIKKYKDYVQTVSWYLNRSTVDDRRWMMDNLTTSKIFQKELSKELSKDGYNAIIDEHGVGSPSAGGRREGVSPLIIFNSNDLKKQSSSTIWDSGKSYNDNKAKMLDAEKRSYLTEQRRNYYQSKNIGKWSDNSNGIKCYVDEKCLEHSAKGSTWEEHKYIKRIDGTYYYPDSYEGGRHLPDGETTDSDDTVSKSEEQTTSESSSLSSDDVEKLANEVIRGNFGNGQQRKDLLGNNYSEVQSRVNEIMKSSTGSKKVSEASPESVKTAEAVAEKASTSTTKKKKKKEETKVHSGVDMNVVLGVYNKKKR